ncbi:MAG: glycosyltransferase family 4 protein [Mucilaginibacter sp.]
MKKKILFVSHDASRTGAPIVLKHLMRWLKDNSDLEFSILIKDGGETDIEDDLRALAPVYKWAPLTPLQAFGERLLSKVSNRLFKKPLYKKYPEELKAQTFDLVYLNTVASTSLAPYLKQYHHCPVILHVHENEFSINAYYSEALAGSYLKLIDHYIAVSKSTRQNLEENYHIPAEKISLVNEFVPVKNFAQPIKTVEQVKATLNITGEFIVGGAGVTSWRKGVDIFMQAALIIKKTLGSKKIKFVWMGQVEYLFKSQAAYELKRLELTDDDIVFTGSVEHPQDYFQIFDVFALTSREDPFPLVSLEAAAQSKPIICFDGAGGAPELLVNGGGIVVPYADAQAMADAIIDLYNDADRLAELGVQIKNAVQQYDVAVQAPLILDVIKAQLSK